MIRYQIRNEYGLSDPELYSAPGEEDDPEALLEGVAMAGLVGVLRQLGDLAEFAAEIFHDLHEDVMATASRGHGLMLRLQQLEAEFPAVEKAIISQTDPSNYPHDDGVDWHANLQLKQNMITEGDMPRFILDSYEECRGPPHLFTLDKFDVAGAGASLKRYSDPSFFKTGHTSNMIEMDVSIEKKPRRIKKKAIRWRKGVTLESLLITNPESHPSPKDRTSRKVPPRITKLKSRHPRSLDHRTVSRICREHLEEIISSQQKILSRYSAKQYHVKFRSTDSSETASPFGEVDNFGAIVQSSGNLELTKVVPVNESDTVETISAPTDVSPYLELGDMQILGKQHELSEKGAMVHDSGKLQDCPNFQVGESNHSSHSGHEEMPVLAGVLADQDADGCRPDDIGRDQDNFIDALNNMDSEGEADSEIETEFGPSANVERIELNCDIKEGENALYAVSPEVGPAIDSSPLLNSSCNGGEPTYTDLPLPYLSDSDPAPSAVSATNGPSSGSQPGRQLNGVDWTKDEEPFDDEDLMGVSPSSSVASYNADLQTNGDLFGCQQCQEEACHYLSGDDDAVINCSDEHSPKTSSGLDGLATGSNDYTDKVYHSVEHGQDIVLDNTSMVLSKPNDVSEDEDKVSVGIADDLFLQPTKPNHEEMQDMKKELEEGGSLDTGTSPCIFASWPDEDHAMCMNDVEMDKDNVTVPGEIATDTAPTGLDPDDYHDHQDGIAPENSGMCNNLPFESYDDEIAEDMHCLQDDGLSTPRNKHAAEDNQIVMLEGGAFPTSLNRHKENSMQASAMARDFSDVQELPVVIQGVPSQEETEAHAGETFTPSSCVFSDDSEPDIGVPLAPSTSSLPDTSSSCVEHDALTEMEDIEEGGKAVVAEESTTSRFEDDVVSPEEFIDDVIYTEKTEVLATNSTEEASRHDLQVQHSSPSREGLETVQATHRNLGEVNASRECISKKRMFQTDNNPPLSAIEPIGEKCSDRDEFLSSSHFPLEADYQEELLEEASHKAEVLSLCDLDKDRAESLESNTVGKQPEDVDQDLAWGMPDQDSSSTNPFMDPAYMTSHTQDYPSPTVSCQPCFPEEQDFLSELLIQHDNVGAAADSLWEPATPPDEAPSPSEVMTEEDFRSFCREYHEIDFSAGAEGCHTEADSNPNNISNAFLVSESDFPCSVSALPVKLHQEACVHSKFGSQCAECSSTMDIQGATSMTFSGKEDLKDEAAGADSHLKSRTSFSDNRSPELDILSVPVDLQQEQNVLSGVDSHSSSPLSDKEKTGERICFPSSDIVEVKQDLEIHANLVPYSSINENAGKLTVPVEPEVGARGLDEYDNQDIPCCSTSEKDDAHPLGKPVLVQGLEVCPFGEFDSPIVPSSSVDEIEDNLEVSALRTNFRADQESECCTSGEHDSQITLSPLLDEKVDEVDGPPLSNAAILDQELEVCVPSGLDSQIVPCSSIDENIHELNYHPLISSVLIDPGSENHVSVDIDSQVSPCSLVKDQIDESEGPQPIHVFPDELGQEALASPELDFQVAPCALNGKVGEIEGPSSCNGQVELEKESDCSIEFDSQTAPCSLNSPVLAETQALSYPVTPSNEETNQLSPGLQSAVQFQNDSYEDPQAQAPPPLPPLQWRLGRPRLGLLCRKGSMPEPPEPSRRMDPVLQASSQDMGTRLGLLDRMDRSIEPVSSQEIKEDTDQSSLLDDNDQNTEFGRSSTSVTITGVERTEHNWPFSKASENINENLDAGVTSTTADEEHLDDSGVTHGTALSASDPLFPLPTDEQQEPQLLVLSSDTKETSEHPSHRHPDASENDKSTDAAGGMECTSTKRHDSENRCYQQPQHVESFSETSDHEERITNVSEEGVKHQSGTSEALSDIAKHSAPGTLLKEGNSKGSKILQEQNVVSSEDDQTGGPLSNSESVKPQDYPHDEYDLEGENRHQPSNPGSLVAWPGDKSNSSGLDEASFAHAEQPPVMGWTVGPQMIHPKYGISVEESQFEANITDNHLIKKPISIRNIPRNPLVDAVAAHDRSSMRKVSELAPSTDKPKPNERNLLLEQIKNKTFNLKPVAPATTAMRSPARANTRNLKVAAIIEKANAIRQAVGSDDEDSWSDA